jgi:hypothetical protein
MPDPSRPLPQLYSLFLRDLGPHDVSARLRGTYGGGFAAATPLTPPFYPSLLRPEILCFLQNSEDPFMVPLRHCFPLL